MVNPDKHPVRPRSLEVPDECLGRPFVEYGVNLFSRTSAWRDAILSRAPRVAATGKDVVNPDKHPVRPRSLEVPVDDDAGKIAFLDRSAKSVATELLDLFC